MNFASVGSSLPILSQRAELKLPEVTKYLDKHGSEGMLWFSFSAVCRGGVWCMCVEQIFIAATIP